MVIKTKQMEKQGAKIMMNFLVFFAFLLFFPKLCFFAKGPNLFFGLFANRDL